MEDTDDYPPSHEIVDSKEVLALTQLQHVFIAVFFKLEASNASALAKLDVGLDHDDDDDAWKTLIIWLTNRNSKAEITRILYTLSSRPAPELCARVLVQLSFEADLLGKKGFENVDFNLFELLRKHRSPLNNIRVRYLARMKPAAMWMLGVWILERSSPSRIILSYEHTAFLKEHDIIPPMNTLLRGLHLHGVATFGYVEIKPKLSGAHLLTRLGYNPLWLNKKMQWFKQVTSQC